MNRLVNEIVETRWVVANQPMKKGRWKCDVYCDTENHHMHSWCTICQRRIDHEEKLNHNCQFGIGLGQIIVELGALFDVEALCESGQTELAHHVSRAGLRRCLFARVGV